MRGSVFVRGIGGLDFRLAGVGILLTEWEFV